MIFLFGLIFIGILFIWKKRRICPLKEEKRFNHGIIIGGSISGMVTAAYLRKHFFRITIVEQDDVLNDRLINCDDEELFFHRCSMKNSSLLGRSNVKHSYQIHVFQGQGRKILFQLFPNLEKKLLNEFGAFLCSLKNHFRFVIGEMKLNVSLEDDLHWFCIDRFTLETILRRELIEMNISNEIQWITNAQVKHLIVDQKRNAVLGLQYQHKFNSSKLIPLYGDFICDCSGRFSHSNQWLKESFQLNIPEDQLHLGLSYLSFIAKRYRTNDFQLDQFYVGGISPHSPTHNKGFLTIPIRKIPIDEENSLGLISNFAVYCVNGEYPPDDSYENLLQWVKKCFPREYYLILKSSELLSPLISYRGAFDQRKYVEKLGKRWPENFVLIGDSMCSFNPKNGQGMTHACRQSEVLNEILSCSSTLKHVSWIYNKKSSLISEECWLGSTTNDWMIPTLKLIRFDQFGKKQIFERQSNRYDPPSIPLFSQFLQFYTFWLIYSAQFSGQLTTQFFYVVFQEKSPFSLLKPKIFLRILFNFLQFHFDFARKRIFK